MAGDRGRPAEDGPWRPPAQDPAPVVAALSPKQLDSAVFGCVLALLLHGAMGAIAVGMGGMPAWKAGFGVLQLGYLAPLVVAGFVLGAGRSFALGVFVGAAVAFAAQAAIWAAWLASVRPE